MAISLDKVKYFVLGDDYQSLLGKIKESCGVAVDDDYEEVLVEMDVESLSLSEVDIEELRKLLVEHGGDVISYSVEKIRKTHNIDDCQELQHEADEVIKFGAYSQGFLLANLIELHLAKKDVRLLEKYIKQSRIPNAKAYAKEVLGFVGGMRADKPLG